MADFLTINNVSLAKVEAVAGTEETLAPASDAVKMEDAGLQFQPESEETNEGSASLDQSDPVIGGGSAVYRGTWNLKGSGSAGTAPEASDYLRSCALGETLRAADLTGITQAGSTSTVLKLAAGDGALVNIGEIVELTSGSGAPTRQVITGISGDDATVYPGYTTPPGTGDGYAVRANAGYAKVSVDCETLTAHLFRNSKQTGINSLRYRMKGGTGNVVLTLTSGRVGKAAFEITGQIVDRDSQSAPTGLVFDTAPKFSLRNADVYFDAKALKMRQIEINLGAEVAQPDDPGEKWARDVAAVVNRNTLVTINPYLRQLSDYDAWTDADNQTKRTLWVNYGTAIGNRVSILLPELLPARGPEDADLDGFAAESLQFKASGIDAGAYIVFW